MNSNDYRVTILGCPVDNLTMEETLRVIEEMIASGKPHQHVVVNVAKLLQIRRDPKLKRIVSSCDIINVDGMPIIWASRLLGQKLKERVAGIDLMQRLIGEAEKKGHRLYFLGAEENVVRNIVEKYKKDYPHIQIVGYRNGYWSGDEEQKIVEAIKNSKPDILFVAISSPKKEIFLEKYLEDLGVPIVMGVGGSFDVIAGKIKRAPIWAQKNGWEWFFRLIQEPRRMWKRYLIGNTIFIGVVIKEFVRYLFKGLR